MPLINMNVGELDVPVVVFFDMQDDNDGEWYPDITEIYPQAAFNKFGNDASLDIFGVFSATQIEHLSKLVWDEIKSKVND